MSFRLDARKAQDETLPMGLRILSLCRCVERYSPIGFQATLEYLELNAGPYRAETEALDAAVRMLCHAHSLWQAELKQYGARRRTDKRAGRRTPRATDPNPNTLHRWHGREKDAALFAINRWLEGEAGSHAFDAQAQALQELVNRAVSSTPLPEDLEILAMLQQLLKSSVSPEAYEADPNEYFRRRRLATVSDHLRVAITTPH